MAKTTRSGRQGARHTNPLLNWCEVRTTLGDLIAAAFDTVGDRVNVAHLLASREFGRVAHARFVLQ